MIADHYLQLRSELENALASLLKLASEMRKPGSFLDTVQGLLSDIRDPLLIVAVGEVKSGKSSLLNALFGQEFAKVDVLPATDRVCIFRFGAEEKAVEVSPSLIERYLPIPFLHDFNVVDTPGTNTLVADHERITQNFIPRADLILFVFSVMNPWTQSAWDLLDFVKKKWLKSVVFVLQQADLRSPAEVEVIRRHLADTAMQKLGMTPPIFAVSARDGLLARTTGLDKERLWKQSQFGPLEEQINLTVTEAGARSLKLQSIRQTAQVMVEEIANELRTSLEVITNDEARLARAEAFLQSRKEQTLRQVGGLLRKIEQACRDAAAQGRRLLEEKLTFWKTWKIIWARERWQREFQDEIESKLRKSVEQQAENAVQLLETDLRSLWPQVHDLIDQQLASDLQDKVPKAVPDFVRQRRELLQSIQLALTERTPGKTVEEKLARLFEETSSRLRVPAGVAAAGGIATAIAAMTSAAVFDVTGVVTASAAIVGTILAFSQRRKILNAYEEQMDSRRTELIQAIEEQLNHAVDLFYKEVSTAFQPLGAFCDSQRHLYQPRLERAEEIRKNLRKLSSRL